MTQIKRHPDTTKGGDDSRGVACLARGMTGLGRVVLQMEDSMPAYIYPELVAEQIALRGRGFPEKSCGELLGASASMQAVFQMMLRVSQSRDPVLILGETGTGKELAARSIHQISAARGRAFVPVDCCTFVPGLMETELFGYVRGAFTGALHSKTGLFETAQGGTVFLDEIAEIPLELQGKLLRALQERCIRPVGSTSWIEFNARIIAATNRDLEASVQKGVFRKDLFFRLNVLTVRLPPLRERKEDIPLLAAYLLAKCSRDKQDRQELSDEAVDCLLAYDWPGNVRELENAMRWAVAWCTGSVIGLKDLPPHVRRPCGAALDADLYGDRMASLREIERHAILRAIANFNGDKVLAARSLGIGKTTIYRKLKEYGIS